MRSGIRYTAVAAGVAVLVALAGGALVHGAGRAGVWAGVAIALAAQVAFFWLLFVWIFPNRMFLAHVAGVLLRFVVLGAVAFVGLPLLGTPAAPTLFALVTVLFVTTLCEPLFLQIDTRTRR
ncbi:MAG TPA: hypothetical protein VFL93_17260 [Longimicrobiaceae bacterium]|nr:hypothetical protein [Longimicrobiaceae bacterium]